MKYRQQGFRDSLPVFTRREWCRLEHGDTAVLTRQENRERRSALEERNQGGIATSHRIPPENVDGILSIGSHEIRRVSSSKEVSITDVPTY